MATPSPVAFALLIMLQLALIPAFAYSPPPQLPPIARPAPTTSTTMTTIDTSPSFPLSTLILSQNNLPGLPEYRSQDQQISAAMPLPTIRGQWRVREERGPLMSSDNKPRVCVSTVVFRGFLDEPNKGIIDYDSGAACGDELSTGRWVSKTTDRVVQLSARWKVKLPAGRFIYKGFISAGSTVGAGGAVNAEMSGLILTGEEVGREKVVGKFTADLLKMFDSSDIKIGESGGSIGFTAK
mmetsp:Transcript_33561/g.49131  ORF Transcript_33561/g.49131 Transcript_33561/m.49131 type:complete len:239 (+) Transcript_33561:156-872(+)